MSLGAAFVSVPNFLPPATPLQPRAHDGNPRLLVSDQPFLTLHTPLPPHPHALISLFVLLLLLSGPTGCAISRRRGHGE